MKLVHKAKSAFAVKGFFLSICGALILLMVALWANFHAGQYATREASNPVTDLVLSNIRVFDVDFLFVYGPLVFWTFVVGLCALEPKRFPFVIKSMALLILVRSVFITLTHIAPFPTRLDVGLSFMSSYFTFGGDLFFSGHTAYPFMIALAFWEKKKFRILFLAVSVLFGVVVLAAHLHYSIDVLGAFFITHSVFHISEKVFKKDRELFLTV